MFETPGIYFRKVFKIVANKFEFEFVFKHKDPRLVISFFLLSFLQTDQERGKTCWRSSFGVQRFFANLSFYRLQFGLEGRGKPEALPAFHPSSLYSSTWSIH
jgi:hypothetical protein